MVSREQIEEIINETIKEYNILSIKCSIIKSSPFYPEAIRLSEKYGLKLKKCTRDQLRFEDLNHINPLNDRITSTELRFDDMLEWDGDEIHFTDTDEDQSNGVYSLDSILGFYDSMPQNLKNGTGLIVFQDINNVNNSTIYDTELNRENVVHITLDAYDSSHGETGNMERVMAHEMGHCFEMGQLNDENIQFIKRIFKNGQATDNLTDEDLDYFNNVIQPIMHTYSKPTGVFGERVLRETSINGGNPTDPNDVIKTIQSSYGRHSFLMSDGLSNDCFAEHFAETLSIVSFRDKSNKDSARINCDGNLFFPGEVKGFDEYVKEDMSSKVAEELLFEDTDIVLDIGEYMQ